MPNNCLSVLYKHIIQVENKNVGLKVGGTHILLPPYPKSGGYIPPCPPPPSPLPTPVCVYYYIYVMRLLNFVAGKCARGLASISYSPSPLPNRIKFHIKKDSVHAHGISQFPHTTDNSWLILSIRDIFLFKSKSRIA